MRARTYLLILHCAVAKTFLLSATRLLLSLATKHVEEVHIHFISKMYTAIPSDARCRSITIRLRCTRSLNIRMTTHPRGTSAMALSYTAFAFARANPAMAPECWARPMKLTARAPSADAQLQNCAHLSTKMDSI